MVFLHAPRLIGIVTRLASNTGALARATRAGWAGLVVALLIDALAASGAERPAPPGRFAQPVTHAQLAKTAFSAKQPIVGTYYFYWYDAETKQHFVDPDGSDALTDHPLEPAGYSFRSADWHYRELGDVLAAGLDFALPVYWGYPRDYQAWSFTGLPPLVEACRRLEREGKRPPRIGLFYDTSTLRHNSRGFHADLTTAEGREWLYVSVRDFYSMIPPDLWATIDSRPLVWLYSAGFAKRQDPAAFDSLRKEFQQDFGCEPFLVLEVSWQGRSDAAYSWGAAVRPNLFDVLAVGPGYDHSAVPGRTPLVRERENGAFYSRSWEWGLGCDPSRRPKIAIVETWNEFHEGTEIAPTKEHGRKYVELTRKYTDLWHAGTHLNRDGLFVRAHEVSVSLGPRNADRGLLQAEHDDGRTEAVSAGARDARRVRPVAGRQQYMYFDVDDSFFCLSRGELEISFDYFDAAAGEISLQYDSTDRSLEHSGAFKPAPAIATHGSGKWQTARITVSDPALVGRANGHDFRLSSSGELTLGQVSVRKRP